MPQFQTTKRVHHSAEEMLALVADVEQYPEFVPYCLECSIMRRTKNPQGAEILLATMTVGYPPIRESFVSRVTINADKLRILVEYVDGPFRRLENKWLFKPVSPTSCDIEFFIDYQFKSRAFELLAGALFDRLFRRMTEAFVERADSKVRARVEGTGAG